MHHHNAKREEGRGLQFDEEFGEFEEVAARQGGQISAAAELGVLWPRTGLQDCV